MSNSNAKERKTTHFDGGPTDRAKNPRKSRRVFKNKKQRGRRKGR